MKQATMKKLLIAVLNRENIVIDRHGKMIIAFYADAMNTADTEYLTVKQDLLDTLLAQGKIVRREYENPLDHVSNYYYAAV